VLFQGPFIITSVNAACAGERNIGDINNAQYHPRSLGNDDFAALTTTYDFGGNSYRLDSASFSASYEKVVSDELCWSIFGAKLGNEASVLVTSQSALTSATQFVTLVGKIKNPNINSKGRACEIGFRAVMYKRVE
jgi:hypothetical protein